MRSNGSEVDSIDNIETGEFDVFEESDEIAKVEKNLVNLKIFLSEYYLGDIDLNNISFLKDFNDYFDNSVNYSDVLSENEYVQFDELLVKLNEKAVSYLRIHTLHINDYVKFDRKKSFELYNLYLELLFKIKIFKNKLDDDGVSDLFFTIALIKKNIQSAYGY